MAHPTKPSARTRAANFHRHWAPVSVSRRLLLPVRPRRLLAGTHIDVLGRLQEHVGAGDLDELLPQPVDDLARRRFALVARLEHNGEAAGIGGVAPRVATGYLAPAAQHRSARLASNVRRLQHSAAALVMHPVLFTGAPGAGKTTLLHALATQGHRVVAESAREVIRSRLEQGLSPRPAPVEFARAVLHRDVLKYEEAVRESGYVFFDRGVPDALGMLEEVAPLSSDEFATYTSRYSYGRYAFLFPAWEAIFENDAERDQSFEDALRVQAGLTAWYGRCGYELIEMPLLPIEGRCSFVLDSIASMVAE